MTRSTRMGQTTAPRPSHPDVSPEGVPSPGLRMTSDVLLAILANVPAPSKAVDDAVSEWLGEVDPWAWHAANPLDHGMPWHVLEPATTAGFVLVRADWSCNLAAAVGLVRFVLPGWWWTAGHCSLTADSSMGPDRTGPDADLLVGPSRTFDEGFDLDLGGGHVCLSVVENLVAARRERDVARSLRTLVSG